MGKGALILVCVVLTVYQVESVRVIPFDILDDAKDEIEALRETVEGNILAAHNKLDDLSNDLQQRSENIEINALLSIQNEAASITEQVVFIKDLANTAHVDISYCLQGREDYLNNLPPVIVDELRQCIAGEINEGSEVVTQYSYLIDITINKVESLNFKLDLCEPDSVTCISEVRKQIEIDTEELPQNIEVSVVEAGEFFDDLQVLVQNCADLKMSQYVSSANTVLRDLTNCVNALLG